MKKTNLLNRALSVVLCFVLIAAMALTLASCSDDPNPADTSNSTDAVTNADTQADTQPAASDVGEGATEFLFTVVDLDGKETKFNVKTDEKTVGAALVKLGLIQGDESEYGLYVKTVNGVTADYDTDKTYWAFYVNGEYASSGVDSTDIEAGAEYSMKMSK